jgi:hypothetical protein
MKLCLLQYNGYKECFKEAVAKNTEGNSHAAVQIVNEFIKNELFLLYCQLPESTGLIGQKLFKTERFQNYLRNPPNNFKFFGFMIDYQTWCREQKSEVINPIPSNLPDSQVEPVIKKDKPKKSTYAEVLKSGLPIRVGGPKNGGMLLKRNKHNNTKKHKDRLRKLAQTRRIKSNYKHKTNYTIKQNKSRRNNRTHRN